MIAGVNNVIHNPTTNLFGINRIGLGIHDPNSDLKQSHKNIGLFQAFILSRGVSVAANIFFIASRRTLLSWGFAKAGAAIHGMTAPLSLSDIQTRWKPARCQRITVSGWRIFSASSTVGDKRYSAQNTRRSILPRTTRFGDLRRRTLSWWRRTRTSACNATRDRNSPAIAHQLNPRNSPIGLTINRFAG